ncbi:MAG: MFS transporter, partial [Spirochaetota bacterium]
LMFFDDSSGINFPYKNDYKDTPFSKVIDKGEITTVEENDIYGSWIYSLGPIYDSKGRLVGILEVGKDLNSFEEKIRQFITDINKDIATVLIILILVMIEIAILRNVFNNKNETASNPFGRYSVDIVRMLAFIIAFAYAIPISYTPLMMKQILENSGMTLFNLPEAVAIAIPISAEMLGTAVFSIFAGNWTQRRGWKAPFIAGALCMTGGSFVAYYLSNPYAFIIARTFIGIAYGFALVTLQCYPMISPDVETRNSGLASQNSGLNAGYCCGVAIGGLGADYMGFSKVYMISVIVSIFALLYAFRFMKNAKSYNSGAAAHVSLKSISRYFSNRNVLLFFITAFIPVSICSMF